MIDGLTKNERKLKKMELALQESKGYKREQLVSKIAEFKRKHFPKIFWNSKEKGTYRKQKEN